MTDPTETRFRRELTSFFRVTLLNVVFAAQAIALGLAYVVAAVLGTAEIPATPALRALAGALALVSFGLGLAWLRSSARVLRGIALIRRPFRRRAGPVSEEALTAGIVGMVAHYRENRTTIRRMILVCTVGGFFFLAQGVVSAVEFASFNLSGRQRHGERARAPHVRLPDARDRTGEPAQLGTTLPVFHGPGTCGSRRRPGLKSGSRARWRWRRYERPALPVRDLLGDPRLLQNAAAVHGDHQPVRPQLEDRAGVPRVSRIEGLPLGREGRREDPVRRHRAGRRVHRALHPDVPKPLRYRPGFQV